MTSTITGESLLVAQFREFYNELIRMKKMGQLTVAPKKLSLADAEEADSEAARSIRTIWQRLMTVLEQQEIDANRLTGDYLFEYYKDVQFILASLADEIFLHLDWTGKDFWQNNLLETKLFNSHSAGDIFFEKLDKLLQTRDPIHTELAKVYLLALALGFEGKYRGKEGAQEYELNHYRAQLFEFITQRKSKIGTHEFQLFPRSYANTLDKGKQKKLPHPRAWVWGLIILGITLLGLSHLVWLDTTFDLKLVLEEINSLK